MASALSLQTRQQRIALLSIIAVASVFLWQHPWGSVLLYPFTILSTWFHEMGHGLAAILMGGEFQRLLIYPDGSGMALSTRDVDATRFVDAFIAAGGPMGPPLAGAACILASRRVKSGRWALGALGAVIVLSTLIWVRSLIGWAMLPAIGLVLLAIAWKAGSGLQGFTLQLVGVQACISTYQSTGYLFSQGGVIDGVRHRSDTQAIADALFLPYWFWAMVITAAIVALLFFSLRKALKP